MHIITQSNQSLYHIPYIPVYNAMLILTYSRHKKAPGILLHLHLIKKIAL